MKPFFHLAHRGDSLFFPENTEISFRSALKKGADVLETDLRLCSDGKIVLSHDPDLRRLTGDSRPVSSLSSDEIKRMDAGALFRPGENHPFRGRGITVLFLEEALSLFPDTRFNLDLKTEDPELVRETVKRLEEAGAVDRVCVTSFHQRALSTFRRLLPDTACSLSKREVLQVLLFHRCGWTPAAVRRGRANVLQIPEYAGRYRLLRPSLFRWCRKRKLPLQIWTVNDPEKMNALLAEGVNGIFTDDPETLSRICGESDGI